MGDERLLVRIRTASYAVPGGFLIVVTHVGDCENQNRDDKLVRCVRAGRPKVTTELATAARAVIAMIGCPDGCRIDKDSSIGILYNGHSQDSTYVAPSGTVSTMASHGTGSLVGERLIKGTQDAVSGGKEIHIGHVSQGSTPWPTGITELGSYEQGMYKHMKLDRSSDEDYVPSSIVVNDVAMSLGSSISSGGTGLGNSVHAVVVASPNHAGTANVVGAPDSVDHSVGPALPSSVRYTVSATGDVLGALAEFAAGALPPRPSELDSDAGFDAMSEDGQDAQRVSPIAPSRLERLENCVLNDHDKFDDLADSVDDLNAALDVLRKELTFIKDNGCSKCTTSKREKMSGSVLPAVPGSTTATTTPVGPSGASETVK